MFRVTFCVEIGRLGLHCKHVTVLLRPPSALG